MRLPFFTRGAVTIHDEQRGAGFPVLALAPGGMRSSASFWDRAPRNPVEQLAPRYRVVAMDQRNAGRSWAPVTGRGGWDDYAQDQLALLDYLGAERSHVLGMCVGGAFALERLASAPPRCAKCAMFGPGRRLFSVAEAQAASVRTPMSCSRATASTTRSTRPRRSRRRFRA